MIKISVVVPTYNRLDRLKLVLSGLEKQTFSLPNIEVVVVSDGSRDGTNEYLRALKPAFHLKTVIQENQGVAVARNQGVAHAVGDIILFIDDDVMPDPHLVLEHWRVHDSQGRNVVVIGPMLTPHDFALSPWVRWGQDRLAEQYEAMIKGKWKPTARQFYTGNTSLARRHLLEHGGFDPAFRRAEDVELAYRLADHGLRFIFCPKAVGYHYEERSFDSWLAIPYAYGRNDVIFTYQKGHDWLLPKIMREFRLRHPVVKVLTMLCMDRPRITKMTTIGMRKMMGVSGKLDQKLAARVACSSLFNIYHYQGIADELGGKKLFLAGVRGSRIAPSPGVVSQKQPRPVPDDG